MDSNNKKFIKKTNVLQFQKLVELMEENPQLATSSPTFGSSRLLVEDTWDNVANKINALGPPTRSGSEWKKVWHDQKSRVKKKIGENNKSMHGTGGGPCTISNLTQMELHIDKLCHLSSATAPFGTVLGLPVNKTLEKAFEKTPPRAHTKVAVVTPTTARQVAEKEKQEEEMFASNISDILLEHPYQSCNPTTQFINETQMPSLPKIVTSTPEENKQSLRHNRKRKRLDNASEDSQRVKLLRQQIEMQSTTLDIMIKRSEADQKQAEAAKIQAEAAKTLAEAARTQAQAAIDQVQTLKEIADSSKVIAQALSEIIKHLKYED